MNITRDIHAKPADQVLVAADTTREGLTSEEAARRLTVHGSNQLAEDKKRGVHHKILDQLKNPMILILIAAGVVSGIFSEMVDMLIILGVVAVNTVMGVVQEGKAEAAIAALRAMTSPNAKVRRNGQRVLTPVAELVPGDVVELEAGDFVPADMRLVESVSLKIEEAALTGESVPAEKDAGAAVESTAVLGDRVTMAYSGTAVVYGRGVGVVTGTGMETEVGMIAGSILAAEDKDTPIQKKLGELSKILTFIVLGVCLLIFGVTLIKEGTSAMLDTFLMAVSLAVAAIPEGLPAVVTIVMALGVQRMARRGAIIRKLPAVETLGCTQVICSDKTGTLTQNRMTVAKVFTGNRLDAAAEATSQEAHRLAEALLLCNDTQLSDGKLLGDPTETALVAHAMTVGMELDGKRQTLPRVAELPFDSERKLMSTLHEVGGKTVQYTKGAPDVLLERCDRVLLGGAIEPMTPALRAVFKEANDRMANDALRVLAAAMNVHEPTPEVGFELENGLVFLGLVGMIDPPRQEAKAAVRTARSAGIRPIMITGDHKVTAVAIARELGILTEGQSALTGVELDKMSDEQLERDIDRFSVYARVSPEHKVRIVAAWQKRGKVAAMTGDGVNDAPALKTADIGVGMGITGTDVTKNVADMVLTDDNFATIILAVEEGRKIYANMRKCVQFLLSCNLAEVLSVLVATLMGHHLLHTIHILWINLVSDTFPALALGIEKSEPDEMSHPPRDAKEGIFAGGVGLSVAYQGLFLTVMTLAAFFIGLRTSAAVATTMAFCTLTFSQMFHSLNVRSLSGSLFRIGLFSNMLAWGAIGLSILITVLLVNLPPFAAIFHLTALTLAQWAIVFGLSVALIPVVEIVKVFKRRAGIGR